MIKTKTIQDEGEVVAKRTCLQNERGEERRKKKEKLGDDEI